MKKGVELFQEDHPAVVSLYDIVHLVSRVVKAVLEADTRWDSYRQGCCRCANYLPRSSLAHLKPPKPKTKARAMNFDREVRWAVRAINQTVRRTGYGIHAAEQVRQLGKGLEHPESLAVVARVADEIELMCGSLEPDARLPGSTEVLESLIGKGKRLLHHSGNSLTRQILSLAVATTEITAPLIQEALSKYRLKHLWQWTSEHFSAGIHVARREDLRRSQEEENLRRRLPAATLSF